MIGHVLSAACLCAVESYTVNDAGPKPDRRREVSRPLLCSSSFRCSRRQICNDARYAALSRIVQLCHVNLLADVFMLEALLSPGFEQQPKRWLYGSMAKV